MFNSVSNDLKIKKMSSERTKICKSNVCTYYDETGTSKNAFVKGKPACGICGCNIKLLTSLPEAVCSLQDLNEKPLWGVKKV